MTALEIINEFKFKYDAASNGGPDINLYEMSLCLTQAWKTIIDNAYNTYETDEEGRRIINSISSEIEYTPTDHLKEQNHYVYNIPLDKNIMYVIADRIHLQNCELFPKIEYANSDTIIEYLNNPFKRPNNRKVVKLMIQNGFKIYSKYKLHKYNYRYIKYPEPIVVGNFETDSNLFGDESIDGINTINIPSNIPEFLLRRIIDGAVINAIKYTRINNIQTQIQIK